MVKVDPRYRTTTRNCAIAIPSFVSRDPALQAELRKLLGLWPEMQIATGIT